MTRVASILFLLVVLMYSTNNLWLYFSFQLNQKEITKNHCENITKPKMHCDGKCYLKKQVEKENDDKKPVNSGKEKFEVLFFSSVLPLVLSKPNEKIKSLFFYQEGYYPQVFYSIVHPPA